MNRAFRNAGPGGDRKFDAIPVARIMLIVRLA